MTSALEFCKINLLGYPKWKYDKNLLCHRERIYDCMFVNDVTGMHRYDMLFIR